MSKDLDPGQKRSLSPMAKKIIYGTAAAGIAANVALGGRPGVEDYPEQKRLYIYYNNANCWAQLSHTGNAQKGTQLDIFDVGCGSLTENYTDVQAGYKQDEGMFAEASTRKMRIKTVVKLP